MLLKLYNKARSSKMLKLTIDMESETRDKHWDSGEKVKDGGLREIRHYS